jgi:hypothetical protein
MAETNTLAYYDSATITAVKSFIVPAPEGFIFQKMTFSNPKELKSTDI